MSRRARRILKDQLKAAVERVIPADDPRAWVLVVADQEAGELTVVGCMTPEAAAVVLKHAGERICTPGGALPRREIHDDETVETELTKSGKVH